MKINLKKPKYIIPLLVLPFLCLFFYVYNNSVSKKTSVGESKGINDNLADISEQVRKRDLTNKLDAYRDSYRESDGSSAINNIQQEDSGRKSDGATPVEATKKSLDSIAKILSAGNMPLKIRSSTPPANYRTANSVSAQDRALEKALAGIANDNISSARTTINKEPNLAPADPMDIFKKQMAYMDSVSRLNDPEYQAEQKRKEKSRLVAESNYKNIQPVSRALLFDSEFNTVMPSHNSSFISAVIDENLTGYAGSRIRIRLLDDVYAGKNKLARGTFLYAEISGFSQQRVKLTVSSAAVNASIIPICLEIYDLDGLPGLYVPSSNFREFSRDLGTGSVQGVSMQGDAQNQQEFLMSAVEKIFTSTSSAIATLIRRNKARVKYNTQVYLIDAQALQKQNQ